MNSFDEIKPIYYIDEEMNNILSDINKKLKNIIFDKNKTGSTRRNKFFIFGVLR